MNQLTASVAVRTIDIADAMPALVLDALVRGLRGDSRAAAGELERALEIADTQGSAWPFLVTTARELLQVLRAGQPIVGRETQGSIAEPPTYRSGHANGLLESISHGELRVLRFLPTHLSATEIGAELCISVHTVKTHMSRIYQKLGVHQRTDAVRRGRELGLITRPTG